MTLLDILWHFLIAAAGHELPSADNGLTVLGLFIVVGGVAGRPGAGNPGVGENKAKETFPGGTLPRRSFATRRVRSGRPFLA